MHVKSLDIHVSRLLSGLIELTHVVTNVFVTSNRGITV